MENFQPFLFDIFFWELIRHFILLGIFPELVETVFFMAFFLLSTLFSMIIIATSLSLLVFLF